MWDRRILSSSSSALFFHQPSRSMPSTQTTVLNESNSVFSLDLHRVAPPVCCSNTVEEVYCGGGFTYKPYTSGPTGSTDLIDSMLAPAPGY